MNLKNLMDHDWLSIEVLAESDANKALELLRWPDAEGSICFHCKSTDVIFRESRKGYSCRACRRNFTVKTQSPLLGAPFEGKKLLQVIFAARDRVELHTVAEHMEMETSIVKKWMEKIQFFFGEEALFPEMYDEIDEDGFLNRCSRPKQYSNQELRNKMANYLVCPENKGKRVSQIVAEFGDERREDVLSQYRNLANWPKARLKALAVGDDPFAHSQAEWGKFQKQGLPGLVQSPDFFTPFEGPGLEDLYGLD